MIGLSRQRYQASVLLLGIMLFGCNMEAGDPFENLSSEEREAAIRVFECALNLRGGVEFEAELKAKITQILKDEGISAKAKARIINAFGSDLILQFPEADREDVYKQYVACVNKRFETTAAFLNAERSRKIQECIMEESNTILRRNFVHPSDDSNDPGGVRCPGGGSIFGSNNRREVNVRYESPHDYHIISYALVQLKQNDGITGPLMTERDQLGRVIAVSALIACDPADYIGADGGWNYVQIVGELAVLDPVRKSQEIRQMCVSRYSNNDTIGENNNT